MSEVHDLVETDGGWRVGEDAADARDLGARTTEYAHRVIRLFRALPQSVLAEVLGKQFLRSGTSVGANYREAYRARSTAEFIAKMGDSLRELDETAYWLELIDAEQTMPASRLGPLRDETQQLIAIFVTCLNRTKRIKN